MQPEISNQLFINQETKNIGSRFLNIWYPECYYNPEHASEKETEEINYTDRRDMKEIPNTTMLILWYKYV